jgi:hypothetical protein
MLDTQEETYPLKTLAFFSLVFLFSRGNKVDIILSRVEKGQEPNTIHKQST